ncbi:MAG: glycosyltransferase [Thermodesulfobacteriota bacterium]
MSDITFSASMIVRNEEKFLGGCLESIRDVVDEVVIVDTGSDDRTKEIALDYGARVFDFPWKGDFASARNEALKNCRGEWILYIDADEKLRSIDKSYVSEILSDNEKVAYTVMFHPILGYTAYREYRIFRNNPRIRFEGVIHESIFSAIHEVAREDRLEIGECDLTIDHLGYEGDLLHKHKRNVSLLRAQIDNDPGRVYLRWQLGVALKGLGDSAGAEKAWMDAISIVRKKKTLSPDYSLPYYDMIKLHNENGKNYSELLKESLKLFPDNYLIAWTHAMTLMHDHQFDEALPIFEFLSSINPRSVDGEFLAYNARIFDELSYEPLATCYFKLGRLKESEKYYELALQRNPRNLEYMAKHKLVSALLNKQ